MTEKRNLKLVVAEGLLSNMLFGTLFVWSVLRIPLLELFPTWNEGMLSLIFGIHNLFTCAGILLGGQLTKRLSTRRVYLLFTVLTVVGLAGFALLPVSNPGASYIMAMILFWFFAATGIGIGINVVQSTTIPWFPKHSGFISGALYMALGISSVILAALARALLPLIGVRLVMPVFAAIILAVSLLILADKESIKPPAEKATSKQELSGCRPSVMLRKPVFCADFLEYQLRIWTDSARPCCKHGCGFRRDGAGCHDDCPGQWPWFAVRRVCNGQTGHAQNYEDRCPTVFPCSCTSVRRHMVGPVWVYFARASARWICIRRIQQFLRRGGQESVWC